MLAEADCADKRLERFRHTRRELEPGQETLGPPVMSCCATSDPRELGPFRTVSRHRRSRCPAATADGNPTREPAGVWPGEPIDGT